MTTYAAEKQWLEITVDIRLTAVEKAANGKRSRGPPKRTT